MINKILPAYPPESQEQRQEAEVQGLHVNAN